MILFSIIMKAVKEGNRSWRTTNEPSSSSSRIFKHLYTTFHPSALLLKPLKLFHNLRSISCKGIKMIHGRIRDRLDSSCYSLEGIRFANRLKQCCRRRERCETTVMLHDSHNLLLHENCSIRYHSHSAICYKHKRSSFSIQI